MKCTCDNGKITVVAQLLTKDGLVPQEPVIMDCIWCNGTGTMTDAEAKLRQSINDAWCKCFKSGEPVYYEQGHSHGYTCANCGKLLQTG